MSLDARHIALRTASAIQSVERASDMSAVDAAVTTPSHGVDAPRGVFPDGRLTRDPSTAPASSRTPRGAAFSSNGLAARHRTAGLCTQRDMDGASRTLSRSRTLRARLSCRYSLSSDSAPVGW